jgi:hypothetical protein
MTQYSISRLETIHAKLETTFGTMALPDATDAIQILSFELSGGVERQNRMDKKGTRGIASRFSMRENREWTMTGYLMGSGSAATAPRFGRFLEALMSTGTTQAAATIASATTTGATITAADAVAAGDVIGVTIGSKVYAVYITDNTAGALTWVPALPSVPADQSIVRPTKYALATENTASLTILRKTDLQSELIVGAKPTKLVITMEGGNVAKYTISGFCKTVYHAGTDILKKRMLANYAYSESGSGNSLPDGTHKSFKISVGGEAAEQIDLAGTELTFTAVVAALNGGLISGLSGTKNKAAVAVQVGTGTGTGFYIRTNSTGPGNDVLLTAGATNNYATQGKLGAAAGGIELDADEARVVLESKFDVNSIILIGSEIMLVTAIDSTTGTLTVTRAYNSSSAAAHDIAAAITPWAPAVTFDYGAPIAGTLGEKVVDLTTQYTEWDYAADPVFRVTSFELSLDEQTEALNSEFGESQVTGWTHSKPRSATVSKLSGYLTEWGEYLRQAAEAHSPLSFIIQAGDVAGHCIVIVPTGGGVEFDAPPLVSPEAETMMLDFADGQFLESSGNDEFAIWYL